MNDPQLLGPVFHAGAIGLVLIGLAAMVLQRNLIRILLGLTLMEAGVNLFLVATGFRPGAVAPILTGQDPVTAMVDPVPQALILTAIVIGVGVLALALGLVIRVQHVYGTLDTRELAQRIAAPAPVTTRAGVPAREDIAAARTAEETP